MRYGLVCLNILEKAFRGERFASKRQSVFARILSLLKATKNNNLKKEMTDHLITFAGALEDYQELIQLDETEKDLFDEEQRQQIYLQSIFHGAPLTTEEKLVSHVMNNHLSINRSQF